jgi:hypothetical protein
MQSKKQLSESYVGPTRLKKHEYIYYPSLGHSRTIGSKWTWVVGIITHLGEERERGEGRGEGAPT